ncbi:GGDEF domain-containing protein [candidate division TA06 bacterium]|uniref:GGDEF domain-containing protein n=1 Tax=candidate division TA06 bacterium TaxID=2250710 RepID=A0A933MJW4_UNCT6|nr:GGDEF domain-containing protein [candidate division TA06 bacterium]
MKPKKDGFTKEIIEVLGKDDGESVDLLKQVDDLMLEKAATLYGDLIYALAHLRFSEGQARNHWENILKHKLELASKLGRNVGIRVSLLDYFTNLQRKLDNPKVIEMDLYEKTLLSAVTDGLTGLYNHRYFHDRFEEEVERARRYQHPLSLLMLDLDDFKIYNDANGHIAGDLLLVEVSKVLKKAVRKVDTAARYGGEEFAIILPSTKKKGALIIAGRICQKIADYKFPNQAVMPKGRITASIGVASLGDDSDNHTGLLDSADNSLYRAKANGKNQAVG